MKSLKINRIITNILFGVVLLQSCTTNSHQINNYKNELINELIVETKGQNERTKKEIGEYINISSMHQKFSNNLYSITDKIDEIEKLTLVNDSIKNEDILKVKNELLHKYSTYGAGKYSYTIDTNIYKLGNCNPSDTIIIRKSINKYNYLLSSMNTNNNLIKLLLLQSNQFITNKWVERYTPSPCGFGLEHPTPMLHYSNKIYYKDEHQFISPGMFDLDRWNRVYIFKENSDQFIMENGEKKVFTNPITLKASSEKGVHIVKGLIYIKYKGELVPKPFEFRYIVD